MFLTFPWNGRVLGRELLNLKMESESTMLQLSPGFFSAWKSAYVVWFHMEATK